MVIVYKNPYFNHMTSESYWVVNPPPKPILFSVNTHVRLFSGSRV